MKTIAFFNHKGGVGKTTLLFNVAVAIGELNKRVVVVDADAQANVTGLALTEEQYTSALDADETIWAAFNPLVSGAGDFRKVTPRNIRDNVWLLPGDIRVSNFEAICPVGWTEALAGEVRGFRVTSSFFRLLQACDEILRPDVILIDLGPNVNALNRNVLIAADGFVVPLAPDLFSIMALPSVGKSIKTWVTQWRTACTNKPAELDLNLPRGQPIPLGYLSQQFSTYRKAPSTAFQKWLRRFPDAYREGVRKPLEEVGIPTPAGEYSIGSLKNFGALIPTAQDNNKAIFELSGREAYGAQYTTAQESRLTFVDIGNTILGRLIS